MALAGNIPALKMQYSFHKDYLSTLEPLLYHYKCPILRDQAKSKAYVQTGVMQLVIQLDRALQLSPLESPLLSSLVVKAFQTELDSVR